MGGVIKQNRAHLFIISLGFSNVTPQLIVCVSTISSILQGLTDVVSVWESGS